MIVVLKFLKDSFELKTMYILIPTIYLIGLIIIVIHWQKFRYRDTQKWDENNFPQHYGGDSDMSMYNFDQDISGDINDIKCGADADGNVSYDFSKQSIDSCYQGGDRNKPELEESECQYEIGDDASKRYFEKIF